MKKRLLIFVTAFTCILCNTTILGQNCPDNTSSSISINTSGDWTLISIYPSGPLPDTLNTGLPNYHIANPPANWMGLVNANLGTHYIFKRVFYVCIDGHYNINFSSAADNSLIIYWDELSPGHTIFTNNANSSNAFTQLYNRDVTRYFTAGIHTLIADAYNTEGYCGFVLKGTISGGCLGTTVCSFCNNLNLGCSINNESCNNKMGRVVVTPTGNSAPYTYLWDSAAGNQTTSSLSGLAAGRYTVTVTDTWGCSKTITAIVQNNPCPPANCCTGGSWKSRSIEMNLTGTSAAVKTVLNKTILTKGNGGIVGSATPSSLITTCDSIYHLGKNGTYTFNANYQCGDVPGQTCSKMIKVKIKGMGSNSGLDGLYNAPVTKTFTTDGNYQVTYYAYCGDRICDSCSFVLAIDKNCCPATKTKSSTITVKNYKNILSVKPLGFPPPLQTYSSMSNVVVNLYYTCPQKCPPTYTWQRQHKNSSGQFITDPNGGGAGASPLSIPVPATGTDRIIISVKCGEQICGSAIVIFNLENAVTIKTTTGFSTGDLKNLSALPDCSNCDSQDNLVINGNFSAGNTGFVSSLQYDYGNGPMQPTHYLVSSMAYVCNIYDATGVW